MDTGIPYINIEDTMLSMKKALALEARARIDAREWASPALVLNRNLWKQITAQTDDQTHMQWCWISTSLHAPGWERMNTAQTKEWIPFWLQFLQLSSHSWECVKTLESGRAESQWIRHLRDAIHAQHAQPLLDWWSSNTQEGAKNNDFFWKAALTTLGQYPNIEKTLNPVWIDELQKHTTDPAFLFQWSEKAARTLAKPPPVFREWLKNLLKCDDPLTRTLSFRAIYTDTPWLESMIEDVILGVCAQEHTAPWPHIPSNVQQMWTMIPECLYATRLNIAHHFLKDPHIVISSSRWPLDFQKMERTIYAAEPEADLSLWGTAPWLAGLLHILPEFSHVLSFHDILPVTPIQARSLVALYKDPLFSNVPSELFEHDSF